MNQPNNSIDFFKPNSAAPGAPGGEFDPATSITLKMVLDQDEADAGSVISRIAVCSRREQKFSLKLICLLFQYNNNFYGRLFKTFLTTIQ